MTHIIQGSHLNQAIIHRLGQCDWAYQYDAFSATPPGD